MKGLQGAQRNAGTICESGEFLFYSIVGVGSGSRPDFLQRGGIGFDFMLDTLKRCRNEGLDFFGEEFTELKPHFVRGASDYGQWEF